MRTYKEMAQRVLKRRDEYEERKQNRKAGHGTVSAIIAASIMVVVILLGTIIGGVLKKPLLAPETDAPPAASSVEADKETTEMKTDDEIETDAQGTPAGDSGKTAIEYIPDPDPAVSIERELYPGTYIYGYKCKDEFSYTMQYNSTSADGEHGDRVRIIIWHGFGIEMLTPEVITLDIPDGTARFELKFKYEEGGTNSKFRIYSIEDNKADIDNKYLDAQEADENRFKKYFTDVSDYSYFRCVRFNGYDFFAYSRYNQEFFNDIEDYFGVGKYYSRPADLVPERGAPVTIDMNILNLDDMYGFECKDVMEYTIQYNTGIYGDLHGDRLKVVISHTRGIELLTPEIFTLDYAGEPVQFKLKFRYVDGTTKCGFKLFFIEDLYEDLDKYNNVEEIVSLENNLDFRIVSRMLECCAIRTKGFDFFKANCYNTSALYYCVAVNYGDIDEDGVPLYKNNPYLPDYYDCDECIEKRNQIERNKEIEEQMIINNENEDEHFRYQNITVSGYVKWTDSEGCLAPARNITVRLLDLDNSYVNRAVLTNDTGYYQITYPVYDYIPHHMILRYEISGLNIAFYDPDLDFFKQEDFYISGGQSQTHSYTFAPNNNNIYDTYLNYSVSIHQIAFLFCIKKF